MIGDLKFLMMMLGRQGYSGVQCCYCQLKCAQWKKLHGDGMIDCAGIEWTIGELLRPFVDGSSSNNRIALDAMINQRGQKEQPLWSFIPIKNIIIPILHLLLGLGNDVLDFFLSKWFDERIDKLTDDEKVARQMTVVADIDVDELRERIEKTKKELKEALEEKSDLKKYLKEEKKTMPVETKENIIESINLLTETVGKT